MTWFLVVPFATTLLANVPNGTPQLTIEPAGVEPSTAPFSGEPPEPRPRWYGAPAVAADAAVAVGVIATVYMTDGTPRDGGTPPALYGLAAAYFLAGPVVHLAHGHRVRAAESLLVRVAGFAAGLAATYALADPLHCGAEVSEHIPCRAPYALALAPLAALVVDDLFLAREPASQPNPPTTASLSTRVLVQPGLTLLGVGGTF
ncbi:MAG TPA: hypothetical protein VHM31_20600 [Polyangia bacterium]|nr:hypothetical protein [Polyangia bacterium]